MANYLRALTMEVTALARACGKSSVHHLEPEDLAALTVEAAAMARVPSGRDSLGPGLAALTAVHRSPHAAEVVVIGGGVAGLSTARALAELGVTDVLVLERGAVGSGGTGKSSGIVRCHYGIPSLAAMAWHALPVLNDAEAVLGAPSGYTRTGYVVGVGTENLGSLRANVAMQRGLGIDVDLIGRDEVQCLWPDARLDDFAGFAYEPRGGYGDGHQTALAFAHAARRHGVRLRQETAVVAVEVAHGRGVGVRLADGDRVGATHIVVAAGPWSSPLATTAGVDLPLRAQRAQILLVDPGRPTGPLPVFSDLVSLQYVRTEGPGPSCSATATTPTPSGRTPTHTANG